MSSNGHYGGEPASTAPPGVESDEVVASVLQSPDGDLFDAGFGLGNYDESLYWQQVRGFRKAFAVYQMFGATLRERAIIETQRRMAATGHKTLNHDDEVVNYDAFDDLGDDERADSKWADTDGKTFAEYGREIWEQLGNEETAGLSDAQERALQEHAGVSERFVSVFESLQDMRHEGSRSKGARLLDDVLASAQVLRDERSDLEVE
ncbi:hypothetical protein [Halobaculum sp. D14]|uniref:hypothetical protein n=1 Tax=Halobaculum sp. D14 TaxID=3421642 RepID=UPI003EBDBEE5